MSRYVVTIQDKENPRLPLRIECDSLLAATMMEGAVGVSARGESGPRLADLAATLMLRVFELDEVALAAAVLYLREGVVSGSSRYVLRDATTGQVEERQQPEAERKRICAEAFEVIRAAIGADRRP